VQKARKSVNSVLSFIQPDFINKYIHKICGSKFFNYMDFEISGKGIPLSGHYGAALTAH